MRLTWRCRGQGTCRNAVAIETLVDTLDDVDTDALRQLLSNMLAKEKAEKNRNTLGEAKRKTLVDLLPDTLVELEAEKLGQILGDLDAKTLIVPLADGLATVKKDTRRNTRRCADQGPGQLADLYPRRREGPETLRHTGRCRAQRTGGNAG